jgi:SAM-dependent methyltransferase
MTDEAERRRADLARYYDQDADLRARRTLLPERIAHRTGFINLLRAEGRRRLLEVGTGPGIDAAAFRAAGFEVTGVDLSAAQVKLARAAGIDAHVAAAQSLPFADRSFDALWSMSVLMHMTDPDLEAALAEFARVLRSGGLAAFGTWGGDGTSGPNPDDTLQPARYFHWRTDAALTEAFERHARVERFETWPVPSAQGGTWRYQWTVARFGDLPSDQLSSSEAAMRRTPWRAPPSRRGACRQRPRPRATWPSRSSPAPASARTGPRQAGS